MSSNKLPKVDFDKTETVGSTRWMRLETLSYHVPADNSNSDGGGESKCLKWDRAVRTTKQSEDSIDAVVILAILKNDPNDPSKDEVVCVKQFRPPVDAHTIELPAGLIDANEDPAVAAAREFTEETGYIGKVIQVLPASYLSPGLTNESASMVKIEVNMSMEQNAKIHNGQLTNTNLEGCEQDRGLEKLLLPRVGLLKALHDLQEKEGVKVFAALYSLALGMSVGESAAGAATTSAEVESLSKHIHDPVFPLVNLELQSNGNPTMATSNAVTSALRDSGFLLIQTPLLPLELQQRVLKAASTFLESSSTSVVTHPSDPKVYAMLQGIESLSNEDNTIVDAAIINDIQEWYKALRQTKFILLHCIAVGLGMDNDPNFFVKLHTEHNDAVRLLKYPRGNENTANRCKEHSDYGTLTLLLNDGIGGLEAFVHDEWRPVPYVEGSIVVNIGSILSEWTRQELKATLHRVAGPASIGSITPKETLLRAVEVSRISIAYFADPNGDVSTTLKEGKDKKGDNDTEDEDELSVADYIRWRSGGEGRGRSGVAFTSTEESRLGMLENLLESLPY